MLPDLRNFGHRERVPFNKILVAMWRMALPADDDSVVETCLRLNFENPGPLPVKAENMRATLDALRWDPGRGRAVVLDIQGQVSGYALLIAFWSNELGGDTCVVDELFVLPEHRSHGHGRSLFAAIARGDLWPTPIAAIALGVTPDNVRARRLYERLGFAAVGVSMVRRLPQ
jgi:GNAT superfamily N-acetyltransferase